MRYSALHANVSGIRVMDRKVHQTVPPKLCVHILTHTLSATLFGDKGFVDAIKLRILRQKHPDFRVILKSEG